ncbi:hypothetical protein DFQ30_003873 [Apophysomyces sp. BC1015]|nr:hypothetical protein DFQ30_003873 [Apophysomyces sp. BC1015]
MPQQPKLTPEQKAFLRQRTKATVSNFFVVVLALRAGVKDYVPGPGEYDVPSEDVGRHKRYGFFGQPNRFGADGSGQYEQFCQAIANETGADNSTTSLSTVSTASSIKTEDARSRKQIMDMANQFEKHRVVMQKEIEALQLKGRKLETNLQAATTEKTNLQATLLTKDQELADMRQKNAGLQKTVARHDKTVEKSPKFIQLTKKLEQMENELESTKADTVLAREQISRETKEHETIVAEKDRLIADLRVQANQQATKIADLSAQLESSQEHAKRIQEENKEAVDAVQLELQTATTELSATKTELREKTEAGGLMVDQIDQLQTEVGHLRMRETELSNEIQQMEAKHRQEIEACDVERAKMEQDTTQLNQQLQHCLQTVESLTTQVSTTQNESAQHLHTLHQKEMYLERNQKVSCRIQAQFETYRSYINHVIQELRDQLRKQCRQRDAELGKVLSELHEAKKFINQQAQNIEGLKSELHWMGKWNKYLWQLAQSIHQDATDHWSFFHPSEAEQETRFKPCTTHTSLMSNPPSRLINVGSRPSSTPPDILKNDSGFGLSYDSKRL